MNVYGPSLNDSSFLTFEYGDLNLINIKRALKFTEFFYEYAFLVILSKYRNNFLYLTIE